MGDCAGLADTGWIGPPDGNGSFESVADGEKVGSSVDGASDGFVDGSALRNEVGKADGAIVGSGELEGVVEGIVLGESLSRTPVDHSSKTPSTSVAISVVPLITSLVKP